MTNYNTEREDLQRLQHEISGRTVFILGGGASVTHEMLNILNSPNHKVVALNSAFKYIRDPTAVMWCDNSWGGTNYEKLALLKCPKFSVYKNTTIPLDDGRGIANATPLNNTGDFGFDTNIDNVMGNNSGAHAINLLTNCGASTIMLVGFDMYATVNKAHFHNDYTYAIRPNVYADKFIPSINKMAEIIQNSGMKIKIYNTNKDSSLKCFEFMELT